MKDYTEKRKGAFMSYIDVNRKISARQASFCTGLNYETLKADIRKGRLKAKRNNKGKWEIKIEDLLHYDLYLQNCDRDILICPVHVFLNRLCYSVFKIYL